MPRCLLSGCLFAVALLGHLPIHLPHHLLHFLFIFRVWCQGIVLILLHHGPARYRSVGKLDHFLPAGKISHTFVQVFLGFLQKLRPTLFCHLDPPDITRRLRHLLFHHQVDERRLYLVTLLSEGVGRLPSFQYAPCGLHLAFTHHPRHLFLSLARALEFFLVLARDLGCLFFTSPNTQKLNPCRIWVMGRLVGLLVPMVFVVLVPVVLIGEFTSAAAHPLLVSYLYSRLDWLISSTLLIPHPRGHHVLSDQSPWEGAYKFLSNLTPYKRQKRVCVYVVRSTILYLNVIAHEGKYSYGLRVLIG